MKVPPPQYPKVEGAACQRRFKTRGLESVRPQLFGGEFCLFMKNLLDRLLSKVLGQPFSRMYSDAYIFGLLPKHRQQIWLITAPKSGSTWLSVILKNYLGWDARTITPGFDRREQEPSLRVVAQASRSDKILWTHTHTRASESTNQLIRQAGIYPIIQTRVLHDSLISYCEHCSSESPIAPMAFMDQRHWEELSDSSRMGFAVDLVAPWYFNFYAGWFSNPLVQEKIAYVCAYENLVSNPVSEVVRICEHFKLPVNPPAIEVAVERATRAPTRLNKGVVGRGKVLSDEQRATLARMRSYYSHIDMSAIGFPD